MRVLPNQPIANISIRECLRLIERELLLRFDPQEAKAHAHIISEFLWETPRHQLIINAHKPAPPDILTRWRDIREKLDQHVPIQHITGRAHFYGRPFIVNPHVLIPRRETEELVQLALQRIKPRDRILDLCTGSGCIAITIALQQPEASTTGVDISPRALRTAERNASLHRVNPAWQQIDILRAAQNPAAQWPKNAFQTIIANPPYIPLHQRESMDPRVATREPPGALFVPDHDPLIFIRAIARIAQHALQPHGLLACECHAALAKQTAHTLAQLGFPNAQILHDAQQLPRFAIATAP